MAYSAITLAPTCQRQSKVGIVNVGVASQIIYWYDPANKIRGNRVRPVSIGQIRISNEPPLHGEQAAGKAINTCPQKKDKYDHKTEQYRPVQHLD